MMNNKQQALEKLEQSEDKVLEHLASLADSKKVLSYFTNPILWNTLKAFLKLQLVMKTTEQNKLSGAASTIIAQSAVENSKKVITITINIGFILFGVAVVGVSFTVFCFSYWKNRFRPMKYNQYAANSNVSPAATAVRTNALYEAMEGASTDGKVIENALRNVDYNGYVDVYDTLGKHKPDELSFSLGNSNYEDLTSFLHGDLNDEELQDLRRAMAPNAATLI